VESIFISGDTFTNSLYKLNLKLKILFSRIQGNRTKMHILLIINIL